MATDTDDSRIPVTLLTGFLGAGKTTLLNHLVRSPDAGRIAVVINEFGDVGLDHDLIEASTEEILLMESGCVCCSIRGDLLKALGKLVARRNNGSLSFDRVVIETTGIADPGPILHSLVVDQLVGPYYRMDGVVTVADAATGPHILETQFEAAHQVAMADLIVLSKTALVASTDLVRFETQLAGINNIAQRMRAERGRIPTEAFFGLSAMHQSVSAEHVSKWLGGALAEPEALTISRGTTSRTSAVTDTVHDHHDHHHKIISASIEVADPISANVFDFWLDTLIALKGPDVLRIKGLVHVEELERPFVFHGVQHIFDEPVPLDVSQGENTTSRVVVIARNMSKDDLDASLQILRMQADAVDTTTKHPHAAEMPF